MNDMITTVRTEHRLYDVLSVAKNLDAKPKIRDIKTKKIGDVIEVKGKGTYLVIGIENYHIYRSKLIILYTCQDLAKTEYTSKRKAYKEDGQISYWFKIKYDDKDNHDRYKLGRTFVGKDGDMVKLTEYTDIEMEGEYLIVSALVKKVHPIDRKTAKRIHTEEKRKQLKLEIIEGEE